MTEAKFVLSKKELLKQVEILKNLGFKISYSYKTNHEVAKVLQEFKKGNISEDIDFSVHAIEEVQEIKDKSKIWFFLQAESEKEIKELLEAGVRNFVVDNEIDLGILLHTSENRKSKINLSIRMKFQEHRI